MSEKDSESSGTSSPSQTGQIWDAPDLVRYRRRYLHFPGLDWPNVQRDLKITKPESETVYLHSIKLLGPTGFQAALLWGRSGDSAWHSEIGLEFISSPKKEVGTGTTGGLHKVELVAPSSVRIKAAVIRDEMVEFSLSNIIRDVLLKVGLSPIVLPRKEGIDASAETEGMWKTSELMSLLMAIFFRLDASGTLCRSSSDSCLSDKSASDIERQIGTFESLKEKGKISIDAYNTLKRWCDKELQSDKRLREALQSQLKKREIEPVLAKEMKTLWGVELRRPVSMYEGFRESDPKEYSRSLGISGTREVAVERKLVTLSTKSLPRVEPRTPIFPLAPTITDAVQAMQAAGIALFLSPEIWNHGDKVAWIARGLKPLETISVSAQGEWGIVRLQARTAGREGYTLGLFTVPSSVQGSGQLIVTDGTITLAKGFTLKEDAERTGSSRST